MPCWHISTISMENHTQHTFQRLRQIHIGANRQIATATNEKPKPKWETKRQGKISEKGNRKWSTEMNSICSIILFHCLALAQNGLERFELVPCWVLQKWVVKLWTNNPFQIGKVFECCIHYQATFHWIECVQHIASSGVSDKLTGSDPSVIYDSGSDHFTENRWFQKEDVVQQLRWGGGGVDQEIFSNPDYYLVGPFRLYKGKFSSTSNILWSFVRTFNHFFSFFVRSK